MKTADINSGISIYWNDEKLTIDPYDKIKKVYYCGKCLLNFPEKKTLMYQIISIDFDDAAFGQVYSDGELVIRWQHHSSVPGKQKCGGQSAKRFANIRRNEIAHWFKRINEYMKLIDGEVYIGMSKIYYKRFLKYLSTYNKEKILDRISCEYAGVNGLYQLVKKLDNG